MNATRTERIAAATLACLPSASPARLRAWRAEHGGFVAALDAVRHTLAPGDDAAPTTSTRWYADGDPTRLAAVLHARGTRVLLDDDDDFPIEPDLPHRPVLLFAEGSRHDALRAPRVAIVGTRAATPHGLADARELGAFLAAAGVTVVSGLAVGIDGAAHDGAVTAGGGAVGVVATGLDVVYPRRHASLYERVRANGLVVGEVGFGVGPRPERFPVRNRIIAALADVVVVVEATAEGGSRITADHALEYGRPVLAVPGSRRNPSAAGCNALLADGAQPLLAPSDVLVALGCTPAQRRGWTPPRRAPLSGAGERLHAALAGEPATLDQLAARTGEQPAEVSLAVSMLERDGWVERRRGWVWPR